MFEKSSKNVSDADDDNESDESSGEDLPDVEEDTTSSRKRKCEFSTLMKLHKKESYVST